MKKAYWILVLMMVLSPFREGLAAVDEYLQSEYSSYTYFDQGGTAGDPYDYGVNQNVDFNPLEETYGNWANLGRTNDYNRLVLDNGYRIENTTGIQMRSSYNTFHISGAGTFYNSGYLKAGVDEGNHDNLFHVTDQAEAVFNYHMGFASGGHNNTVLIDNGARVVNRGEYNSTVGWDTNAKGNILTVSGSETTLVSTNDFTLGLRGDENEMNIEAGATASFSSSVFDVGNGTYGGLSNRVNVSGTGSRLAVDTQITVGASEDLNSTLTVSSNAVVETGYLYLGGPSDKLRMNKGIVAVEGDNFGTYNSQNDENIQLWDDQSDSWVTISTLTESERAALGWEIDYYSDDASAADAGYEGYGGYTVMNSGGVIPEPGASLLIGSGILLFVVYRRIHKAFRV